MSADRLPQDSARDGVAEPGQPHDDQIAQIGGWPIDQPFPLLLTPAQLQLVFQIAPSYYFKLQALGRFSRFEAPTVLGAGRGVRRKVRYSGEKVRDFLRNEETTHARTFGAKRGPRRLKPVVHDGGSVASFPAGEKPLALASNGDGR